MSEPYPLPKHAAYIWSVGDHLVLAFPPTTSLRDLSEHHPYHRLARVVEGRSYLDDFARAPFPPEPSARRRRRPGPGSSP